MNTWDGFIFIYFFCINRVLNWTFRGNRPADRPKERWIEKKREEIMIIVGTEILSEVAQDKGNGGKFVL